MQADKARIMQMLHDQNYPSAPARHPGGAENRLRRIKSGSDSDNSSIGDSTPLMLMPPVDRSHSSMSWGPKGLPDGPKISLCGPLLAGSDELSRSRESISAFG